MLVVLVSMLAVIVVFVLVVVVVCGAPAHVWVIYGRDRDAGVSKWGRLIVQYVAYVAYVTFICSVQTRNHSSISFILILSPSTATTQMQLFAQPNEVHP